MPDLTIATTVAAIEQHTGLERVKQTARRQREDGDLPSSRCGTVPAKITARHVALILLGALTADDCKDATRTARAYGALCRYGEPGETLIDHLAACLTCPARPLVDLTL